MYKIINVFTSKIFMKNLHRFYGFPEPITLYFMALVRRDEARNSVPRTLTVENNFPLNLQDPVVNISPPSISTAGTQLHTGVQLAREANEGATSIRSMLNVAASSASNEDASTVPAVVSTQVSALVSEIRALNNSPLVSETAVQQPSSEETTQVVEPLYPVGTFYNANPLRPQDTLQWVRENNLVQESLDRATEQLNNVPQTVDVARQHLQNAEESIQLSNASLSDARRGLSTYLFQQIIDFINNHPYAALGLVCSAFSAWFYYMTRSSSHQNVTVINQLPLPYSNNLPNPSTPSNINATSNSNGNSSSTEVENIPFLYYLFKKLGIYKYLKKAELQFKTKK